MLKEKYAGLIRNFLKLIITSSVFFFLSFFFTIPAQAYANPYSGGWSNCTWGAWQALYESTGIELPAMGNAANWIFSAQSLGYSTGMTPTEKSIAVYSNHVAYVSAVSEDKSSIYIIEGGFNGGYNERWVSSDGIYGQSLRGYIYMDNIPVNYISVKPAEITSEIVYEPVYYDSETAEESNDQGVSEEVFDQTKPATVIIPGIQVYSENIREEAVTEGIQSISFETIKKLPEENNSIETEGKSLREISKMLTESNQNEEVTYFSGASH